MRFAHLVAMLNESGREAVGFLQERAGGEKRPLKELEQYSCIVANWPMRWPLSIQDLGEREIMEHIAPGSSLLLCGPKFPPSRRWDLQYVNLWEDEQLLQENAYLTAEGAVASTMQRSRFAMAGQRCTVIGYGRIGRALTEILLNLGAEVAVVSGSETKRRRICEAGAEAFAMDAMERALKDRAMIFSTPPAQVVDRKALAAVQTGALILDLASPPYGVDLDAAREMNLNAWREPGLPGRYCPMSAARALYRSLMRWEEAEKHE